MMISRCAHRRRFLGREGRTAIRFLIHDVIGRRHDMGPLPRGQTDPLEERPEPRSVSHLVERGAGPAPTESARFRGDRSRGQRPRMRPPCRRRRGMRRHDRFLFACPHGGSFATVFALPRCRHSPQARTSRTARRRRLFQDQVSRLGRSVLLDQQLHPEITHEQIGHHCSPSLGRSRPSHCRDLRVEDGPAT